MKHSSLPLVLLVLLAAAVALFFRPIRPGDIGAMADKLGLPAAWADDPGRAPDFGPDDPRRPGPQQPISPGRPAAWPSDPSPGGQQFSPGPFPSPAAAAPGIPAAGAEIRCPRRQRRDPRPRGLDGPGRDLGEEQGHGAGIDPGAGACQDHQEAGRGSRGAEDRLPSRPADHPQGAVRQGDGQLQRGIRPENPARADEAGEHRLRREFEQKLRETGITLEIHKRAYIEGILAQEWVKSEVKADEEVSYDQIVGYYQKHPAEFVIHPPLARWEQLMVRTSRFPSDEAARAALAEMGNQVLDRVPLAEVAKARSQGSTASDGGLHDWTGQHSLASAVLDDAIFSLPINQLSPILQDDQGFHIIRVLQRQPVAMKSLADAQVEIRKKIKAQRQADAKAKYIAKIRQQTPVWTAFDNDHGTLSARLGGLYR